MNKRARRLSLIAFVLAPIVAACGQATGPVVPSEGPRTPVSVVPVKEGDVSAVLSFSGNLVAPSQVQILPKISGQIVKMNVDIGSKVKQGDPIAELDHTTLDAQLDQAQANLEKQKAQGRPESISSAQATLAAAQAAAGAAQAKLQDMQNQGRPDDIAQAKAKLDQEQAKLEVLLQGSRPEDIAQQQAEVDLQKQKLAQLIAGPTPQQVSQVKAAVEAAKSGLYLAQANRDAQQRLQSVDQGKGQVAVAQATVIAAQAAFDATVQPPTPQALQQQRDAVTKVQEALDKLKNPSRPGDIEQQRQAVTAAQQALDKARLPNTPQAIAQQRQLVAQAQQQAAQAAAQVALAVTPFTTQDIAVSQAAVEVAKTQRDQAFITAPFEGVIADKSLSVGGTANPNQPLVTLVGTDIEINLTVPEAQLPQLAVGQPVQITTAAYPNDTFEGKVTTIAPTADPKSRTFVVKVVPSDTTGKLKAGMLAKVSVTTAVHKNVPLVPKESLLDKSGKTGVFVVEGPAGGEVARFKPVTTGLQDDKNVEVNQGVKVGDLVVVSGQAYLNDNDRVRVTRAS